MAQTATTGVRLLMVLLSVVFAALPVRSVNVQAPSPDALQSAREALHDDLNVVFVMDPNFGMCWEVVHIDAFTNATLLPWVRELKDALTITYSDPGQDLQFEFLDSPWHDLPSQEGRFRGSFRDLVENVWQLGSTTIELPSNLIAMFQLSMANQGEQSRISDDSAKLTDSSGPISAGQIRATSVNSFWQVVEQTAGSGELRVASCGAEEDVRQACAKQEDNAETADLMKTLEGAVFILPRMVPHLHNWYRVDESDKSSRQVLAWGADYVTGMLQAFVEVAGVATVPTLREYRILPDKEKLQAMYQAYHDADPKGHTPPIPTAFINHPANKATQQIMCHSDVIDPSPQLVDDIMQRIFAGVLEVQSRMESMKFHPIDEIAEATFVGPERKPHIHFALKRTFSECALNLLFFELPLDLIIAAGDSSADKCIYRGEPCWRAGKSVEPVEGEFKALQGLSSEVYDAQLLRTKPYLQAAAEAVASKACGEAWMLQPKIMNMPDQEYRVYLIGGASAQPGDEVVVYTPSTLSDTGIALFNLTLPRDHVWSDSISPPAGPRLSRQRAEDEEEDEPLYKNGKRLIAHHKRKPWHSPDLYNQIVQAGLDGARALAAHEDGKLSTIANGYVRVDIVLAAFERDGQLQTIPLINEMDWFNSAMVVYNAWKQDFPVDETALQGLDGAAWESASGMKTSRGYKTAKALLPEILNAHQELITHGASSNSEGEGACPTVDGLSYGLKVTDNRTMLLSQQPQPARLGEATVRS